MLAYRLFADDNGSCSIRPTGGSTDLASMGGWYWDGVVHSGVKYCGCYFIMNYTHYWRGLFADLWGLITFNSKVCPHCMRICALAPFNNWKWNRRVKRFATKLRYENEDHTFDDKQIDALLSSLTVAVDGDLSYLFSVMSEVPLSSLDYYNHEDVVIPAADPKQYTLTHYDSPDALMAHIRGEDGDNQ